VLNRWHGAYSDRKDAILKLHTGQGKTLIGLLILQSRLNGDQGPALYLCPNKFLVNQTCNQAKQFGLSVCTADDDLPSDFVNCKSILVATVQKLFNGQTKFGLGNNAQEVGAIVVDDAHACVDAIRNAFVIRLDKDESAYTSIRDLFADELERQGIGTFADIQNGEREAILPIPYWAWQDRVPEVAKILAARSDCKAVRFAWPLLRDVLDRCQCVVSGGALEIVPYLPPLYLFKSYENAGSRVFMSATVADDSFLVKGLGLAPEVVSAPLMYENERWSGEKMVLIPSLIDESLDRARIISWLAKPAKKRGYGVVVLAPSFRHAHNWRDNGAVVADTNTIDLEIEKLRSGHRDDVLVIVNRYDGIDLPDDSCRLLIFDSEPYSESLVDLYTELCRPHSETTVIRKIRTIEQGLGRAVRGERDYCIVVITGPDLVKCVRSIHTRGHLSKQTQLQIQIGFEIADMAKEDLDKSTDVVEVVRSVMAQCLRRDHAWKAFYAERMEMVESEEISKRGLDIFAEELKAELLYQSGDRKGAVGSIQSLIDSYVTNEQERGWYLQEMARYTFSFDASEADRLQRSAHLRNHALLKPRSGMQTERIIAVSHKRVERAIAWIRTHESYEEMRLAVDDMLERLSFGVKADRFEDAFNTLGILLGFVAQRPEKEWKEGPDNLWGLRENEYLVVECKSEVDVARSEIEPREAEQMNRSCAWFDAQYRGAKCHRWIAIPPRRLSSKASFTHDVRVLRKHGLSRLVISIRKFIEQLRVHDLKDLSERKIQELFDMCNLSVDSICSQYAETVLQAKRQ
jgi:replicative superfamily II helicase